MFTSFDSVAYFLTNSCIHNFLSVTIGEIKLKSSLPLMLILLVFGASNSSYAVNKKYSPFSQDELERMEELKYQQKDSDVYAVSPWLEFGESAYLEIYKNDELVYRDLTRIHAHWFQAGAKQPGVDLDGNGLDDVVKSFYNGSQGLMLGQDIYIYLQYEPGKFRKFELAAEAFSSSDIVDYDGDGVFEIINSVVRGARGSDGKIHNYWVYRCWNIDDTGIRNVDSKCGLPKVVLFTHQENHKLASLQTHDNVIRRFRIDDRFFKSHPYGREAEIEQAIITLESYFNRSQRVSKERAFWLKELGTLHIEKGNFEAALPYLRTSHEMFIATEGENYLERQSLETLMSDIVELTEHNNQINQGLR